MHWNCRVVPLATETESTSFSWWLWMTNFVSYVLPDRFNGRWEFYVTTENDYFNRVGCTTYSCPWLHVIESHCASLLRNSLSKPHMGVPPSKPSEKHVRITFSVEAFWAAAWRMISVMVGPTIVHKTSVWWFLALIYCSIGFSCLNFLVICHIKTFLWNWKMYVRTNDILPNK